MLRLEQATISIPRNGNYSQEWRLNARSSDDTEWEPIDLTGHTLSMKFKAVAGQGSDLAEATITVVEVATGRITVTIDGTDFDAVEGETEIVTIAYDLKDEYPDGTIQIYPRGHALLIPGVS